MGLDIRSINEGQADDIEERLEAFDKNYITYDLPGRIQLGAFNDGKLIAGLDASMTAFKILYLSTLFVDEDYRGQGVGKALLERVEEEALKLGANMIRLDTFNWQGRDFYRSLGYEEVGSYKNDLDGFSEHFFLKRLD